MCDHHWEGRKPDPDKYYGFIYLITNLETGKMYVGRKFYHTYKKRKKVKQSDWANYTGSSKWLNADIKELGITSFEFKILY